MLSFIQSGILGLWKLLAVGHAFVQPITFRSALYLAFFLCLLPPQAASHEPKPETIAAFNHYRDKTVARMNSDLLAGHFLYIDRFPDPQRQKTEEQLRRGEFYLEQLHTFDGDHRIPVPAGIIHHWLGIAFLPKVTLAQAKSVLEDYDHQKENYFPDVRESKLLSRREDSCEVFLQFYSKTIVTAVFNVNFSSRTTDVSRSRTQIRSCSTRVADVDNFGTPNEHELSAADSHGYLWRLCIWWRLEEKNGGTYVQVEAIELSRTVPFAFAWIVSPIIRNVPKTFLSHLLGATQKAIVKKFPTSALPPNSPFLRDSQLTPDLREPTAPPKLIRYSERSEAQ